MTTSFESEAMEVRPLRLARPLSSRPLKKTSTMRMLKHQAQQLFFERPQLDYF